MLDYVHCSFVLVIIHELYQTTGKLALLDSNLSTLDLSPRILVHYDKKTDVNRCHEGFGLKRSNSFDPNRCEEKWFQTKGH